MGGRERRANGHRGWKPGHRRQTPDPNGRSWWEHMLRPQRSSPWSEQRSPLSSSRSPERSSRLQPRLLRWMEAPPVFFSPTSSPCSAARGYRETVQFQEILDVAKKIIII